MSKESVVPPDQKVNRSMYEPVRHDRTPIYQGIALLMWVQYCLEQNIPYEGFDHAPKDFQKVLLDLAESTANMALEPDRKDAALMCMAERILEGNSGVDMTFRHVSRQTAWSYLTTAQSALGAFMANMKDVAPDGHYRDEMSRLVDSLAPKDGVM